MQVAELISFSAF